MTYKKIEIELMQDEYWWGGAVGDGISTPYGLDNFSRDLGNLDENQGMPLLISNKGRYIWSDAPFSFSFKKGRLAAEGPSEIVMGDGHKNLREVYNYVKDKYFPPSAVYPDLLAFEAPQYNTWIEMFYGPTQKKVMEYAEDIIRHGFPPGVLIIDDNWMMDYGNWTFKKESFPDPKGMMQFLHALGFKVMLWVCPYVSPDSAIFRKLQKEELLLKTIDGSPAIREWWNGYSGVLDYTNPAAVEWFFIQLDSLVDEYGVDGFKFDAGDPAGMNPQSWNKQYSWYNAKYENDDCEAYGKIGLKYSLSEYRACWKCAGTHLIQRQKDKKPVWEGNGLDSLIKNGLLQGLLGYHFNCPDMIGGGMEGDMNSPEFKFDQELFIRYLQCSVLFPIMQFSVAPWRALDEIHMKICSDALKIREKFASEIIRLAQNAAETGEPIIRHMEYEFPGSGYDAVNEQFMLGNRILVAPVIKQGSRVKSIVIPEGIWVGDDGSSIQGPVTIEVEAPISRLPYYIRK